MSFGKPGCPSPVIRRLWLSVATPATRIASPATSPARAMPLVFSDSPNKNTPRRAAVSGSAIVKPGCDAASGPAASACEASSIAAAPTVTRTYTDQLPNTGPRPWPRWELSSLMTAATNPQLTPVATPRIAARRTARRAARAASPASPWPPAGRRAASTTANSTKPPMSRPASHHRVAGACSRPPDGAADSRKRLIPADMPAAASHSRSWTRRACRRAVSTAR